MADRFIRKIKEVYEGLPIHLIDRVFWVTDQYRKNPLSLIEGGTDVVVEYHSQEVFGYDKIKFPPKYMDAIFTHYFKSHGYHYDINAEKVAALVEIKAVIRRIFAKKYENAEDYNSTVFSEIWNSDTSNELPSEALQSFHRTFQKHLSTTQPNTPLELNSNTNYFPMDEYYNEVKSRYFEIIKKEGKRLKIELDDYSLRKRRHFPTSKFKEVYIKNGKISINFDWLDIDAITYSDEEVLNWKKRIGYFRIEQKIIDERTKKK